MSRAENQTAAVGGIEVIAETTSGDWVSAGDVHEMGPLATDIVVVPLPADATGRVRLRMARGHWRIDYLASARQLARRWNINTPIIEEVYSMLYEAKDAAHALRDLTGRESKAED